MYYLNENVVNLNRMFDQNSREYYLRLDLNENPGGLPDAFIKRVLSQVTPEFLSKYPETSKFTEALAQFLGIDCSHICMVNGSAEGIRYMIETFTSDGGKIVGVAPTYAMYEVYAKMYGRIFVPVPYTYDLNMPVGRILDYMTPDTQLLILVNPNNPIGNTYTEEAFKKILEQARKNEITILIDEAYHYFYPDTFIRYAVEQEHVFVTRTFSKLFSLAGARLGYVAGSKGEIQLLQKMCTPHHINAFAQLFAQNIIQEEGMIASLVAKFEEGRDYIRKTLAGHGYETMGGTGNFIFIKQKTGAHRLVQRMKQEKRILIKMYEGIGRFGDCIRVSIGEKRYMEIFADALLELDQ